MARKLPTDSLDVPEDGASVESAPLELQADPVPPVAAPVPAGRRVPAYDVVTGNKLPYPVPLSHLDGRFPNLSETPSSKAGK